jgi:hypothetical protein
MCAFRMPGRRYTGTQPQTPGRTTILQTPTRNRRTSLLFATLQTTSARELLVYISWLPVIRFGFRIVSDARYPSASTTRNCKLRCATAQYYYFAVSRMHSMSMKSAWQISRRCTTHPPAIPLKRHNGNKVSHQVRINPNGSACAIWRSDHSAQGSIRSVYVCSPFQ